MRHGLIITQNVPLSKRFENMVLKFFPNLKDYLFIDSFHIERASGYGHYKIKLTLSYGSDSVTFSQTINDSQLWDWYYGIDTSSVAYRNWFKRGVLAMLEDNSDTDKFMQFYAKLKLTNMKPLTLKEYAKLMDYKGKELSLEKIQEYLQEECDFSVFDYPMEEMDYVIEQVNYNLVLVDTEEEELGVRICEF